MENSITRRIALFSALLYNVSVWRLSYFNWKTKEISHIPMAWHIVALDLPLLTNYHMRYRFPRLWKKFLCRGIVKAFEHNLIVIVILDVSGYIESRAMPWEAF